MYILAKNGKIEGGKTENTSWLLELTFYRGSAANPTDFFLNIITIDRRTPEATEESTRRVEKLIKAWSDNRDRRLTISASTNANGITSMRRSVFCPMDCDQPCNSSIGNEMRCLIQRYFRVQFRDTRAIIGQVVQTVVLHSSFYSSN